MQHSPRCLNCFLASARLLRLTACAFYQPVPADMSRCLSLRVYSETRALLAHWGVCVCMSEFVCRGFNSPQISGLRLAGSGGWPHWQISRSYFSHSPVPATFFFPFFFFSFSTRFPHTKFFCSSSIGVTSQWMKNHAWWAFYAAYYEWRCMCVTGLYKTQALYYLVIWV